jgi:hypothetical protein
MEMACAWGRLLICLLASELLVLLPPSPHRVHELDIPVDAALMEAGADRGMIDVSGSMVSETMG